MEEVRECYRFYPETIMYLCQLTTMERRTQRSQPLPDILGVLVSLHFLATGTHHIVTAALHGVSRVSVSRAVKEFTGKMYTRFEQFVHFTDGLDMQMMQQVFYNVAGFPQVIGAVDGTQIRIQAPSHNEDDFMNRKGFHSTNVQMTCDASFKFLDVVAKWPGSVHDSRIFRESDIYRRLEAGEIDGLLLGWLSMSKISHDPIS